MAQVGRKQLTQVSSKETASIHRQSPSEIAPSSAWNAEYEAAQVMRREVALYIGQMSAELAQMSRASSFQLLSYFLDMAANEARSSTDKITQDLVHGNGES